MRKEMPLSKFIQFHECKQVSRASKLGAIPYVSKLVSTSDLDCARNRACTGVRGILGAFPLASAMFAREADKKEAASMERPLRVLRKWQHFCSMQEQLLRKPN
jgi:hypothetical protein